MKGIRYQDVDFNADGTLNTAPGARRRGLPEAVAAGGITDLFVFSHGWNNGVDSARDPYNAMFGLLADQLGAHLATSAAVGVIWPSLRFSTTTWPPPRRCHQPALSRRLPSPQRSPPNNKR